MAIRRNMLIGYSDRKYNYRFFSFLRELAFSFHTCNFLCLSSYVCKNYNKRLEKAIVDALSIDEEPSLVQAYVRCKDKMNEKMSEILEVREKGSEGEDTSLLSNVAKVRKTKFIEDIVEEELIEYPESVQAAWDSLRFWGQVWNSFNTTLGWTIFFISIVFVVCTIYFDQLSKLSFLSLPIIPSPFILNFLYESAKFDGEDLEEKKFKEKIFLAGGGVN